MRLGKEAEACSRKRMVESPTEETEAVLDMRRLAMVSTGWNMSSSAMPVAQCHVSGSVGEGERGKRVPEVPEPRTRAVPLSLYFPPAGGDIVFVESKTVK